MRLRAQLEKNLHKAWSELARVFNGHVSFGNNTEAKDPSQNIDGVWLNFVTPTPDTDFTVDHNLGRLPVGYIVMTKTAPVDIYTGSMLATATQLTLRATNNAVAVALFVI